MAIIGLSCNDSHALFEGVRGKRWVNVERVAARKLAQLDWSNVLDDLKVPPRLRSLTATESKGVSVCEPLPP